MRLLLLFLFLHTCSSLKILVYNPTFAGSHVTFMGAIADRLVDAGHTVHMIVTEMDNTIKEFGSKKAHKVVFVPSNEVNAINYMEHRKNPFKPFNFLDTELMKNMTLSIMQLCTTVVEGANKWTSLKSEHYDVLITEIVGFHPFAMMHYLGVKTTILAYSITPLPELAASVFNIPSPPSFVPNPFFEWLSLSAPDLSYAQRALGLLIYTANLRYFDQIATSEEEIFRAFDPSLPPLWSLIRNSSLFLVNTHPLLEFPRPTSHRVIHIGGMTHGDTQELDNATRSMLKASARGNVLVSFGSFIQVTELDEEMVDAFVTAFSRFPDYNFIWKFDGSEEQQKLVQKHKNIRPVRWTRQKAILNHPRTKAFISHMGANSFIEGAFAGVPFVSIPLFADQPYNAAQARRLGIARIVSKYEITAENIYNALDAVLNDKSVQQASKKLQQELHDFPDDPADRMVEYVEFVGKNGRVPQLDIPTVPFLVYYSLDILVPLFLIILLILYLFCRLSCYCCCGRSHRKVKFE